MTTDTAERTDVQTPEPVITPQETTEPAPVATAPASTPEPVSETPIPEEVQSFLKEQGYSDEDKGDGADAGTKGEAKPDIPAEELRAEGARTERERIVRQGRIEGVRQAYRGTATRLIEEARKLNLNDTEIGPLVTILAEFNGQASGYYAQNFIDGLYTSLAQSLPEADRASFLGGRDKHGSYADAVADYKKAIEGQSRKGWVSEKAAEKKAADAVKDFVTKATKAGLFSGSKNISTDSSVSLSKGAAPDKVLEDQGASREDKARAFERKYGFKPT